MKKLTSLILLFLISSCGYNSYEECLYKEIKDGNPKTDKAAIISKNAAISFCRSKFPKPQIVFEKGVDYKINWTRKGDNVVMKITNYSDKTIHKVKFAMCNKTNPGNIEWDKKSNLIAGTMIFSGQSKEIEMSDPDRLTEQSCFTYHATD